MGLGTRFRFNKGFRGLGSSWIYAFMGLGLMGLGFTRFMGLGV